MSIVTSSKFAHLPRLQDDGSNWTTYKDLVMTHLFSKGLSEHVLGTADNPAAPIARDGKFYRTSDAMTPLTEEEYEKIMDRIRSYVKNEALLRSIVYQTVTPHIYAQLKMSNAATATELWNNLATIHEKKGNMVQMDVLTKLATTRCPENGDIHSHLATMFNLYDRLATIGAPLTDIQYAAYLQASLPPSYRPLLTALSTGLQVANKPMDSTTLIRLVREEADTRAVNKNIDSNRKSESENSAMVASAAKDNGRRMAKQCDNCKKKGHVKEDCWAKGGGAEGQAPEWWNPPKNSDEKEKEKNTEVTAVLVDDSDSGSDSDKPYALVVAPCEAEETGPATVSGTPNDIEDFDHALTLSDNPRHHGIIVDCGANRHFTPLRQKLSNYVDINPEPVRAADGRQFLMIGKGDLAFDLPNMAYTLVSVQTLARKGNTIHFEKDQCIITTPSPKSKVIGRIPLVRGLYRITEEPTVTTTTPDLSRVMERKNQASAREINARKLEPTTIDSNFVDFDSKSKEIQVSCPKKHIASTEDNYYIDRNETTKPGDKLDEEEIKVFNDFEDSTSSPAPKASERSERARVDGESVGIDSADKSLQNEPQVDENEPDLPKIQPKPHFPPLSPLSPLSDLPELPEREENVGIDVAPDNAPQGLENVDPETPEPPGGRKSRTRSRAPRFYKEPDLTRTLVVEPDSAAAFEDTGSPEEGGIEVNTEGVEWRIGVKNCAMPEEPEPDITASALSNPKETDWKPKFTQSQNHLLTLPVST